MALIGDIIRTVSSHKQYKRLKDRKSSAGTIGDRIENLKKYRPELEIDTSGYDAYAQAMADEADRARARTVTAQYEKATAGGRPEADALMREENRRASANTVAQAKNTMSSASDTLAALAIADAQERVGNRQIDVQSAQQIEANKAQANQAYQQTIAQQAQANANYANSLFTSTQAKNIAEQQMFDVNQMDPYMQALFDDRQMQALIDQARGDRNASFAMMFDNYQASQQQRKLEALKLISTFAGAPS